MAKYDPLKTYLLECKQPRITMSFSQIAAIVGVGRLPQSAYDYQAWWANEQSPRTHVQKQAWRQAGYIVDQLNLAAHTVTFARRS